MDVSFLSATGNRFAMVDGFSGPTPRDPAALARELCARHALDGVLVVERASDPAAACAMRVWNADGSRAETCGNGLRCVGRLMVEHGHSSATDFAIETDVGPRAIKVLRRPGGGWSARTQLGHPRLEPARVRLDLPTGTLELDIVAVDLGNPHCVLFVPNESTADVSALGPLLERHARFPKGANVEFAAPDGRRLGLRVWERGVGETASCGSGACAAAAAAIATGRMDPPVEVEQSGGWVLVEWDERDGLWLSGPVEDLVPTGLGAAVSGGSSWTSG